MARKIVWTLPALEDLESIYNYIHRDSAYYARQLVLDMLAAAETLSDFPLRGRNVPESGDFAYREILVDQYRLIYKVSSDVIHIMAIIHIARDLASLLGRR
jgi:toxin ParE1/3/4